MNELDFGKCADCPFVMHALHEIDKRQAYSLDLSKFAMSEVLDKAAESFHRFSDHEGIELTPEVDSPEEIAKHIRQSSAQTLNEIDESINKARKDLADSTKACEGPLKMRAKKAGRIVTATVCSSPKAPLGFSCEEIHLNRKPAD